jgi:hypothetical protein
LKPCWWLDFGGGEVGKALREVGNCSVGVRKAGVEPVMPSVEIRKRAVEVGKPGVVVVGQGVRGNSGMKEICANSHVWLLDAERLYDTPTETAGARKNILGIGLDFEESRCIFIVETF